MAPGGYERYFAAIAGPRMSDDEICLMQASDSYGVEPVGPPLGG